MFKKGNGQYCEVDEDGMFSTSQIDFAGLDRRGVVGTLKEGEFEYSLKTSQVFLLGMAARVSISSSFHVAQHTQQTLELYILTHMEQLFSWCFMYYILYNDDKVLSLM